jgi:hypothetical protein
MKRASLRLWFALAAAVVAAALADPCVEAISNAGAFGRAAFTDHSNLDVLPALALGAGLLGALLVARIRGELLRASGDALRGGIAQLLPAIFVIQIAVLFTMETLEQLVVAGHLMGGTIWLGGPAAFSLAVHALFCVAAAYALAALVHTLARHTVRVIRSIRAIVERRLHGAAPLAVRAWQAPLVPRLAPILCRIGNRAPPHAIDPYNQRSRFCEEFSCFHAHGHATDS